MSAIQEAFATIQRRRVIVIAMLIVGLIGIFVFLRVTPRSYLGYAQVLTVGAKDGRESAVSTNDLPSFATSTVVLQRVIERLNLPVSVVELKGGVKARLTQGSDIMAISYQNAFPDRAVAVPNIVAEELSRYYEEISTRQADADIRKLRAAVDAEQKHLQETTRKLAGNRIDGVFLGDEKTLESTTAQYNDLLSQRAFAQATYQGDVAQAQAQSSSSEAFKKLARREILQNNVYFQELIHGTAKDRAELAFDRGLFTPAYPGFAGLNAKVHSEAATLGTAEKQILASADAVSPAQQGNDILTKRAQALVAADQAKVSALDGLIAIDRERMQSIPKLEVSTSWLRLQSEASKANYLALATRLNTATANRALALGSLVVLDRAVSADTVVVGLGRSRLILMLSAFVVALAIISAFLAEFVDPRFVGTDSIENVYGAPLVTTLKSKV